MKKFWNLMLAALVIFGAVACTENQEENIPEAKKEPVLSFVANIDVDETRTDLKEVDGEWTTVWSGDDILYVYNYEVVGDAFKFVNSEAEPNVFKCTDEGVRQLIGRSVQIDNSDNFNSTTGKKGGSLYAAVEYFQPNANISLTVNSSFFRFSSYFDVTLELSSPAEENYEAFVLADGTYSKTVTLDSGDDVWVAFKTYSNCTLTAKINDQVIKSKEGVNFAEQMIYNLGEIGEKVPNETFGIVGGHQGWDTAKKDAMYLIPGSNTYVRYNVKLADGFKFYGETSKTVTIEHPEVTGGETGYLFLKPNSNWTQANARFAAYFFGNGTEWVSMTDSNKDGIYAVQKPSKNYPNVIFCRMNPSASANNWDNKWNQTGDLKIPTDGNNLFTVPSGSWDGSTTSWSKHTPVEHQDAWTEVTEEITSYWFGKNDSDNISNWVTGYSNNAGQTNITVSDTNKTYDIYFSREADQDWGFVYYFAVKESNSEAPKLK